MGTIVVDRWAPDFTHCDMSKDPSFKFEKRRLTIYETEEWQLVGLTFPSFWRPNQVPVRVAIKPGPEQPHDDLQPRPGRAERRHRPRERRSADPPVMA